MSQKAFGYETRVGVQPISWNEFHGLCKALALAVYPFQPQLILAVGRGGHYAGTLLAHMLQVEIYAVRLTRRVNDVVVHETPRWIVEPPYMAAGQRVLIVDEISSTGETLAMVKRKTEDLGAAEVKTAVLYAHTWGVETPDYIGMVSDALLLNPWDREVLREDGFQMHPEYVEAMALQGIQPDSSLLVDAPIVHLAKGMM